MKVLGCGGHAKVVIDVIQETGNSVSAVYDDDETKHGREFAGVSVEGCILHDLKGEAIIGIGDNEIRKKIAEKVSCDWKPFVHPTAVVADDVKIGKGSVIMAGAIVQPGTEIGDHVIVNTGSTVDHDCVIEDYCHIAPNCSVAGGVQFGEGSFLGIGSSVIQYKSIGKWSVIGAGSVIVSDIMPRCTVVGAPAEVTKFHNAKKSSFVN